jgi:hypothetical protein
LCTWLKPAPYHPASEGKIPAFQYL